MLTIKFREWEKSEAFDLISIEKSSRKLLSASFNRGDELYQRIRAWRKKANKCHRHSSLFIKSRSDNEGNFTEQE